MYKSILFLIGVALLVGCGSKQPQQNEAVLMVTIEPMRYLVEELVGDRFQVVSMVPKGSSPETYEATPRQMIDVSQAKAYLRIGPIPFELHWMGRLQKNAPSMQVFDAHKGVELIAADADCGHNHGGKDPHIWSSPRNMAIVARNVVEALKDIDPENSLFYETRLTALLEKIAHLDEAIESRLAMSEKRTFVIYHPALGYFARDYGLTQLAIEHGGKLPTPAQLKLLIETCRAKGIQTILVQQEFPTDNAITIAKEIGARVVTVNPLAYAWDEELLHIINEITHE